MVPVSIGKDDNFSGFDRLEVGNHRLFILAEQWHNIRLVPRATMKLLKYLHKEANVRILAIEQGTSAATMINTYLISGDTTQLRRIARNTMFWGKENWAFFEDLRAFNQTVPSSERILVRSIDVEYKMESAIFYMNELIGDHEIPDELDPVIGAFNRLFDSTQAERESYQGLAVMFYYDKDYVTNLVNYALIDIQAKEETYRAFFRNDFKAYHGLIQDMYDGLIFDYTNPNTNYKFRDRLIYQKFVDLLQEYPNAGILCAIGLRHATRPSSIFKLANYNVSPVKDQVMNIRITAPFNNSLITGDLRKINFNYPGILKSQEVSIIYHDPNNRFLKSRKGFDYTIFINEGKTLTPFEKVLREDY